MATTTQSQWALANDRNFIERLSSLFMAEALVVAAEAVGTANHAQRRVLAQQVITNPRATAANFALAVTNATNLVAANTLYDFTLGAATTDATDAAIRSQIASLWNTFSGV